MTQSNSSIPRGPGFFDDEELRLQRRIRRQRALFIPQYLREASINSFLRGEQQDRAYEIALRWADLESSGKLSGYIETSIDTQFLDQVIGEGLGYALKTAQPQGYQLEHKYVVPEIGTADAALGDFPDSLRRPTVLVELKDARTDLDRERIKGRTAVQQCWDYLNAIPACTWGIVSNFRLIRLYHRDHGTLAYEEFTLQELRSRERFNQFYCIFERGGLLPSKLSPTPRALALLERTQQRQRRVGDALYESYSSQRLRLIEHLMTRDGKSLDAAIRIAQKLLDRVIFIAFCEDRGLLSQHCLKRAGEDVAPFSQARNPLWQNFLGLFADVDRGSKYVGVKDGYNGSLFKPDPEIDELELEDHKWAAGFKNFGTFDFSEEVNVEVLGHLFERSITELEKLRVGGLFALKAGAEDPHAPAPKRRNKSDAPTEDEESSLSKMPKSAQRKRFGIYYTPPAFTTLIVQRTIDAVVAERFAALQAKHQVNPEAREDENPAKLLAYWSDCLDALKAVTVCDPACGSGAFLIRAYDALDAHYKAVVHGLAGAGAADEVILEVDDAIPDSILQHNLFGVDLSEQAVDITQLALWIRSARKNRKLSDLSRNILCGNSLVADPDVHPKALHWQTAFPRVFAAGGDGGFTCVIGNPPWERMKLEEREFFWASDARISTTANAAERKRLINTLESKNPELWDRYIIAQASASRLLSFVRTKEAGFPLSGKGDVNLYMLFAELATRIVSPTGRVGLLLPSGIATDHTTQEFFRELVESKRLTALYDFVNRFGLFPDVEGRLKFCILLFSGTALKSESMDFVFWAERVEDIAEKKRHVQLSARDIQRINPNTHTCPIFRSQRDAELTKRIYKRVPILVDKKRKQGGNPWGIRFFTMFHQTNDAGLFGEARLWEKEGYKLVGNTFVKRNERALPLLEAKMTREYDHRASWVTMNPKSAYMNYSAEPVSLVDHQNPEFLPKSRYWVGQEHVEERAPKSLAVAAIGFHDVARANDTRTMVACMVPFAAYSNKLPLVVNVGPMEWRRFCCLLGNMCSYVYDFVARQKVGGANLNFFIVEQLPTLRPDTYADKCPWAKRQSLETWISERVLKLSCTAEDMIPLAQACGFKGSRGDGVHLWKESERAELRAELDAAYFHLYGIARADVEYILSTFTNTGLVHESDPGAQQSLWKGGSVGEMILGAYDRLTA